MLFMASSSRYSSSSNPNGFAASRSAASQGLTLVQFPAQPQQVQSHLPVSPCLIDRGIIMHPTHPTNCAYVEPKSGRV